MRKSMRSISIVLVTAMVASLMGCAQNGGNTAETVAQETTAAEPSEGTETTKAEENKDTLYTAGTYEGTSPGRNGDVTVLVTVSDTAIESVEVKEHIETEGLADLALTQIPQDIVTYQSLGIDAITGATFTSNAVIRAVAEAIETAGGDADALYGVEVKKELGEVENLSTQVVVVGGGASGMMAAIAAADKGAEVTLVEKLPFLGGSFLVSAAVFTTVDSENQTEYDDTLEHAMEFVRQVNGDSVHQPDYEFLSSVLSQTGDTIDYMIDDLGLEATFSGGNYVRTQFVNGPTLTKWLTEIMEEKGIRVITDAAVESILMDGEKAAGVMVNCEAGEYTIQADKVIIAAGGASWDKELMKEKNPELAIVNLNEKAGAGNTGDGIRMLQEIGAQVDDVLLVKSSNVDFAMSMGYTWKDLPSVANQLIVDEEGKRFANEAPLASTMLNTYMLRHPSKTYYGIFDTVNTNPDLLADLQEKAGNENPMVVVYGETMEELAEKTGMDAKTLQESFERYQQFCIDGEDPDFGKAPEHLVAYADEGGYYAAYLQPASWGTIGGVITDEQMHVLREDGTKIENVFAVGETATSRLFGDYYIGGFSLGLYFTAGRIAAETAVAEINGQS